MDSSDEGGVDNLGDIDWDEDAFNLSSSQIEDERTLIEESHKIEDEEAPSQDHLDALDKFFGHKSFRPMQWKIISSIINDKRDNCAVMATGYGKSLCFQYPSVYCGGLTIVISPLISLMEDQVLSLKMANIPACLLGSAQTKQRQVIDEILNDKYSLVYLTPEFCCGDYGQDLLKQIDSKVSITLIAIDEAHCVSTWGHDFRFQYRELGKLRIIFPHIPILAVTATATKKVRSDIVASLKLRNPQVLCSGFDRPNLYFSVFLKGSRGPLEDLQKYMIKENGRHIFTGSTIIYCITRKQTEDMAILLNTNGIKCASYHGSMSIKARSETHEQFVKDKIKVIVATIAFGMGIDKPDVRRIIHYGSSKDLESYYQEVGRAGRDGQPAECVTFYSNGDFEILRKIREHSCASDRNNAHKEAMAQLMQKYFDTRDCRRQFILNHFEGTPSVKKDPKRKCCDNCTRKLSGSNDSQYEGIDKDGLYDFTQDAHVFLAAVNAMQGRFGAGAYILFVRGSKNAKISRYQNHPLHGSGKSKSDDWWKAVALLLEREQYLQKVTGRDRFCQLVSLSRKGEEFLDNVVKRPHLAKLLAPPSQGIFKLLKKKVTRQAAPARQPLTVERNASTSSAYFGDSSQSSEGKNKYSSSRLKLLKPPSKSHSVIGEIEIPETKDEAESDEHKAERMKIFRILQNKRVELASKFDCMPYMVASDEALLKMAQQKPFTMRELRQCQLQGFNEAKIQKFGPDLVRTMRMLCNLDPELPEEPKRPIEEILKQEPLPGAKIGNTALFSYGMFKGGLTIGEIATKRGILPSAVISHLTDGIKLGYPIKLIDLNISDEDRNTIIGVIKGPKLKSNMTLITLIKMACPEHITFDAIKVVIAYIQVRDHLQRLHIRYEDFEEPYEDIVNYAIHSTKQTKSKEVNEPHGSDLDRLVDFGNNLINEDREKAEEHSKEGGDCQKPNNLNGIAPEDSNSPSLLSQTRKRAKVESDDEFDVMLDSPPICTMKRSKTALDTQSQEVLSNDEASNVPGTVSTTEHKSDDDIISESPQKPKKRRSLSTKQIPDVSKKWSRIRAASDSDSDVTIIEDPAITCIDELKLTCIESKTTDEDATRKSDRDLLTTSERLKHQGDTDAEELLEDKSFDHVDFDNIDYEIENSISGKNIAGYHEENSKFTNSCKVDNNVNDSAPNSGKFNFKQFKFKKSDKNAVLPSWLSKGP